MVRLLVTLVISNVGGTCIYAVTLGRRQVDYHPGREDPGFMRYAWTCLCLWAVWIVGLWFGWWP